MLALMPFSMAGCDKDGNVDWNQVNEVINALLEMLGWNFNAEDTENVPDSDPYTDNDVTLESITWENRFPVIGDQGSYGTCVAWSTGYALKSALNNMDEDNNNNFIASPVDLWHLIGSGDKSSGCNGTSFEPALDAMQKKGVASMTEVPFTNKKMTCDGVSGIGNAANKLGAYRIIAYTEELSGNQSYGMTVANFKGNLENGPVVIGVRLGERFMQWNNSTVLSGIDSEKVNGQHAYHALVVVGYDDSKRAFRVRNSWGTGWGDNGSIWIDYDFFLNHFCFGAWVANNPGQTLGTSSVLRSTNSSSDLQMKVLKDYETADGNRIVEYDIKNTGSDVISANKNWSAVYLLFRKNRLSERYILFQDYYSSEGTQGKIASNSEGVAVFPSGNTVTNVNIAPGSSAAGAMNGTRLAFEYTLPLDKNGDKLNGDFYMVLIADAFGNVCESELENNFCFLTGRNGEPINVTDGRITNIPTQTKYIRTLVSNSDPNNYSGIEIVQTLQRQLKNGMLTKIVQQESGLRNGKIAKKVR
jgi:hypothetical protein